MGEKKPQEEEAKLLDQAMKDGKVDNPELDPPDVVEVEKNGQSIHCA